MASTNQNLKDFFALTGDNPSVTNSQLQDVGDWLTSHLNLDSPATTDDVINYVYSTFRDQVLAFKRRQTGVTWE